MIFVAQHVVSGDAFFTGAGLLLGAIALGLCRSHFFRRSSVLVAILGIIAISISGTPLGIWYFFVGAAILLWLFAMRQGSRNSAEQIPRRRIINRSQASALLATAIVVGLALEMPYRFSPRVPLSPGDRLTIFGDSLTAGIGIDEETWPEKLAKSRSIAIEDRAQMGATVSSALKIAKSADIPSGVVLIEIGGNDILGVTSQADFHRDLDELLAVLSQDSRRLVMFELPLPPFRNAFGRSQRTLARKYGVQLIPKHMFASVLAKDDATLDSIHLTSSGHQRMADQVWAIVRPTNVAAN